MRTILITIGKDLTLTGALALVAVGAAASFTLTARGGTAPYRITVNTADLPDGWSMVETILRTVWTITDSEDGEWVITSNDDGTVDIETTEALAAGEFTIVFRLKDGERDVRLITRTLRVVALPLEVTGNLTDATEAAPYSVDLTRVGGAGLLSITSSSGLPTGLAASVVGSGGSSTVRVSGTPSAGSASGSPYAVLIAGEDAEGTPFSFSDSLAVASAPIAYDAFNPSDKGPTISLSNANRTVAGAGNIWNLVRSITGKNSGKHYFEFVVDTVETSPTLSCAMGFAEADVPTTTYVGATADSYSIFSYSGNGGDQAVTVNAGAATTVGSWPDKTVPIAVGIDFDAGKIWFGTTNGQFSSLAAVEAGLGGDFTFTPGTTLYPAIGAFNANTVATANFGQSAFAYTVPAGFAAGWTA